MKGRALSLLLASVLLLGLSPTAALAANAAEAPIKLGDYIQIGTYDTDRDGTAEPILWRCVAFEKVTGTDANGNPIIDSTDTVTEYQEGYLPLMFADNLICEKEFDAGGEDVSGSHGRESETRKRYGSNYWGDSNLRDWLNSSEEAGSVVWSCGNKPSYAGEAGFLTHFSDAERAAIQTVCQKTTLAEADVELEDKTGTEIYMPEQEIANVVQNYSAGYSQWFTDTVFLMDTQQLHNVYDNDDVLGSGYYYSNDNAGDLLRTPFYYNGAPPLYAYWNMIVIEYADIPGGSTLYVTGPFNSGRGVRPAFYLDPRFELRGSGTKDAPYQPYHLLTHHEAEKPTCTASGNDEYWECSVCDKLFSDSKGTTKIAAVPTLAATGHTSAADWTKDGSQHWHICTVCHELTGKKESHTEGKGVVTTQPTSEAEGIMTYSCTVCGQVLRTEAVAKLEPPQSSVYTVAFDTQFIGLTVLSQRVTEGGKAVKPDDPARSGYTFGGWYKEAVCTTAWSFDADTVTGDMALYAKWSKNASPSHPSSDRPSSSQPKPIQPEEFAFVDVPRDAWYYDAVEYVTRAGLFNGTSKTTFSPNGAMTRAMLVTVLYRAAGEPVIPDSDWGYPYADVDAKAYYGMAVYWARLHGIADGYDNGNFGPNDPITREQLAAMLYRYANSPTTAGTLVGFTDADQTGGWAIDAIRWAVEQGILVGKGGGVLDPKGEATRAEVAAMLMRYMKQCSP